MRTEIDVWRARARGWREHPEQDLVTAWIDGTAAATSVVATARAVLTSFSTPVAATCVTRNRFVKTRGCSQLDFEARHGGRATGNVCRAIGVASPEQADPTDAGK